MFQLPHWLSLHGVFIRRTDHPAIGTDLYTLILLIILGKGRVEHSATYSANSNGNNTCGVPQLCFPIRTFPIHPFNFNGFGKSLYTFQQTHALCRRVGHDIFERVCSYFSALGPGTSDLFANNNLEDPVACIIVKLFYFLLTSMVSKLLAPSALYIRQSLLWVWFAFYF